MGVCPSWLPAIWQINTVLVTDVTAAETDLERATSRYPHLGFWRAKGETLRVVSRLLALSRGHELVLRD